MKRIAYLLAMFAPLTACNGGDKKSGEVSPLFYYNGELIIQHNFKRDNSIFTTFY